MTDERERAAEGGKDTEQQVSALNDALSDRIEEDRPRYATGEHWTRRVWLGALLLALVVVVPQFWVWQASLHDQRVKDRDKAFWLLCHGKATADERARAFLTLVNADNSEWRSARLTHLQLVAVDLRGTRLEWSNFDGSTLAQTNLTDALLTGSTFRNAKITRAKFSGAQLRGAEFHGAELSGSDFSKADLRGAFMVQADLSEVDFAGADLSSADLRSAKLNGSNLSGVILRSARLDRADLTDSNLRNADLSESNWWRALGLRPETLADCRARFSPTSQSDAQLRADFHAWAAQISEPGE